MLMRDEARCVESSVEVATDGARGAAPNLGPTDRGRLRAGNSRLGWALVAFSGLIVSAALAWPGTLQAGTAPPGAPAPADLSAQALGVKVVSAGFATGVLPEIQADDAATAQVDPSTGQAQYSDVARNTGGTLGDYLKTTENMGPALRATSGDFARQVAALDAAHAAMARAALAKAESSSEEAQGRQAIQGANEAINAQGKADEYTQNLLTTGAFERQWGRRPDQQLAVSPGPVVGSQNVMPASVLSGDSVAGHAVIRFRSGDDDSAATV